MDEKENLAAAAVQAIREGDAAALTCMLDAHPELASVRLAGKNKNDGSKGVESRTLLHIVTDWPGHVPNGAESVAVLVRHGADVNARFLGAHSETPLHWAASCDDVAVLDALLDAGANIEASGSIIAGGTPLDNAVAFAQWNAARRLVERGAQMALWHAAALGRMDAVHAHFTNSPLPARYVWGDEAAVPFDETTVAFWCACHGGQQTAADDLLARGAELNWVSSWDGLTPLDAAQRSGAVDLVHWLRSNGARSADEQNEADR